MMPLFRAGLTTLLLSGASFAADANPGVPKQSPFMAQGAGAGAAAPSETLEFAGISTMGGKTDVIIYDKTAKKSHWIAQGETKEGITVVNYLADRDQAVVKVNGAEKVLPLRKVSSSSAPRGVAPLPTGFNVPTANAAAPQVVAMPAAPSAPTTVVTAPAPAANPSPPAPPATPEAAQQAKQETEARMLVSDLLEIGMAQRKAYEEAQRKAGSGTPQPPPQETPAPARP